MRRAKYHLGTHNCENIFLYRSALSSVLLRAALPTYILTLESLPGPEAPKNFLAPYQASPTETVAH